MNIRNSAVVRFHYVMLNKHADVLEDSRKGMPAEYLHGSNSIQPFLQSQLEGMEAGGHKQIRLPASSGLAEDDFSFEVWIEDVREALPEEISQGYPMLETQPASCGEDCGCHRR